MAETNPAPDRRQGRRYTSLLRIGVIETAAGKELCLIRNISAGGLMVHLFSPFRPGTRAAIELKTGQQVSGTLIWCRDGAAGLQFDQAIDVGAVLAGCAPAAASLTPRMPRIEADRFVSLRLGARLYRARTRDISQGGVKVKVDAMLRQGDVVVTMAGLRPVHGVVRWCDGVQAGISFNQPIPLGELVPWLKERSDAQQPFVRAAALAATSIEHGSQAA